MPASDATTDRVQVSMRLLVRQSRFPCANATHLKAKLWGASSCICTPITCYTTGQVKNRIIIYHTVVRQNYKIDN